MLETLKGMLKRNQEVTVFSIVGMLLLGVVCYIFLPNQIAIHWSLNGDVNQTISRQVGIFILPVLATFVTFIFRQLDTKDTEQIIESMTMLLLLYTHFVVLVYNIGYKIPVVPLILGMAVAFTVVLINLEIGN